MSFGHYVSMVSQNDKSITAIPIFSSRVARLSAFYIRGGASIEKPEDLAGKRIGVPEWTQTATIYTRGWLSDYIGVDLTSIDWVQTGVDEGGREEPMAPNLPTGLKLTPVADRSLAEMLLTGDLDAVISATPPKPFRDGDSRIKRLFPDHRPAEEEYHGATGIFPIMHVLTLKTEILDRYPWAAMNLNLAFDAVKNNSLQRALDPGHSIFPIPWGFHDAQAARHRFGEDFWPYGLEANRATLEAFVQFAFDQGVAHRKVTAEELFPDSLLQFSKT